MKLNSFIMYYFHQYFAINIIIFTHLFGIQFSNDNPSKLYNQFPNDIIIIGEKNQTYVNFITFSNGDLLFQTSFNNKRKFYGLKSNGRGYFINETSNIETPFYSLTVDNIDKYESGNSIFVKDGKEYFLSMGRLESYTEYLIMKIK